MSQDDLLKVWLVIAGGLIGIAGSATTPFITSWLSNRRYYRERRSRLKECDGRVLALIRESTAVSPELKPTLDPIAATIMESAWKRLSHDQMSVLIGTREKELQQIEAQIEEMKALTQDRKQFLAQIDALRVEIAALNKGELAK